ncbi:unnamed protein product [Ceratitis capitata]|uniref:(Mediterranean fruit fly) hypothetical protein n=1 Tax=Ceratitis capitata TaxID=7213 RepID=A0A811V0M9_CERCA|nr:unnamed protein product [Ceratitis capitata]
MFQGCWIMPFKRNYPLKFEKKNFKSERNADLSRLQTADGKRRRVIETIYNNKVLLSTRASALHQRQRQRQRHQSATSKTAPCQHCAYQQLLLLGEKGAHIYEKHLPPIPSKVKGESVEGETTVSGKWKKDQSDREVIAGCKMYYKVGFSQLSCLDHYSKAETYITRRVF